MMKHKQQLALAFSLIIGLAAPASAGTSGAPFGPTDTFDNMTPVSDEVLSKQRGGFVTPGGLLVDFAITTRTIVDGDLVSDLTFDAEALRTLSQGENLQEVIQIGQNNNVQELDALQNLPGVTVVIQNSLDQKVIQNLSILDIAVENFNQFQTNHPLTNALLSQDAHTIQ